MVCVTCWQFVDKNTVAVSVSMRPVSAPVEVKKWPVTESVSVPVALVRVVVPVTDDPARGWGWSTWPTEMPTTVPWVTLTASIRIVFPPAPLVSELVTVQVINCWPWFVQDSDPLTSGMLANVDPAPAMVAHIESAVANATARARTSAFVKSYPQHQTVLSEYTALGSIQHRENSELVIDILVKSVGTGLFVRT